MNDMASMSLYIYVCVSMYLCICVTYGYLNIFKPLDNINDSNANNDNKH